MRLVTSWLAIAAVVAFTGCRREEAKTTELQRLRSGAVDVVLLSSAGALHHGKDVFVIEFRSATDGSLIDVGNVRGSASMSMSGTPMLGTLNVTRTSVPGRYSADTELSMAGTWRMTVEWDRPQGQGSVNFSSSVQ